MNLFDIFKKTNKPAFSCREIAEILMDFMGGRLDKITQQSIERHLEMCKDCRNFIGSYKKTVDYLKGLPPRRIPEEFSRRLEEVLLEKWKRKQE